MILAYCFAWAPSSVLYIQVHPHSLPYTQYLFTLCVHYYDATLEIISFIFFRWRNRWGKERNSYCQWYKLYCRWLFCKYVLFFNSMIELKNKTQLALFLDLLQIHDQSHTWQRELLSKRITWWKLHLENITGLGVCRLHLQERRGIAGRG